MAAFRTSSFGSASSADVSTLKRKNLVEDNSWLSLERKKTSRGGEAELLHGEPLERPQKSAILARSTSNIVTALPRRTSLNEAADKAPRPPSVPEISPKPRGFATMLANQTSSSGLDDTLKKISDPTLGKKSWQPERSRSRSRSRSDHEDEIESQEEEGFGDLSRARSFWKNLDSETLRRSSMDSTTLSRRQSQELGSSAPTAASSLPRLPKAGSQQPVRPERKIRDAESREDISLRIKSLPSKPSSWKKLQGASARNEPKPDYDPGDSESSSSAVLLSKSLVTSQRDEQRRSQSLEKKFSLVGGQRETSPPGRGQWASSLDRTGSGGEHKKDGVGRKLSKDGGQARSGRANRRASVLSDAPSYDDRSKSPEYNRGRRDSVSADQISRRNSLSADRGTRRHSREMAGGSAMDVDYDRGRRDYPIVKRGSSSGFPEDFGPRDLVAVGRRAGGGGGEESKHFLSLQIFSKVL
jgi:hypothetical protein